jgi:hypothetical protein
MSVLWAVASRRPGGASLVATPRYITPGQGLSVACLGPAHALTPRDLTVAQTRQLWLAATLHLALPPAW